MSQLSSRPARRDTDAWQRSDLDDDAIRHTVRLLAEVAGQLDVAAGRGRAVRAAALEQALSGLRAASAAVGMALVYARDRSRPYVVDPGSVGKE